MSVSERCDERLKVKDERCTRLTYTVKKRMVYYETTNREVQKRLTCECRCDERLKV